MQISNFKKNNKGYSLVEMVIYVGILSLITVSITTTLLSFVSSYRDIKALRIVDNSAVDSLERMTRDIRSATIVDDANSTLGSSPGVITIVQGTGGNSTTTKFYLQNNIIKVDVNGSYSGPITISNASVSNLTFYKIDNGLSKAVKIDITVSATIGLSTETKTYHSTVILKG